MKNNLILLLVVFLSLPSNRMFCAEKRQTWSEWIKAKLQLYSGSAYPVYKTHTYKKISAEREKISDTIDTLMDSPGMKLYVDFMMVGIFLIPNMIVASIADIIHAHKYYKIATRNVQVRKISKRLALLIGEKSLYPTRSSQINELIKRDEFIQAIDDEDGIVNDAASILLKKIDSADKRDFMQKEREAKIDAYISKLKAEIAHFPLEQQIEILKKQEEQPRTILEATGYLSLYNRLKAKLVVEESLTPEQKAQRVQLPVMTLEQEEKFKAHKQDLEKQAQKTKEEAARLKKQQESIGWQNFPS